LEKLTDGDNRRITIDNDNSNIIWILLK
jgi:hypothetical protein